MGRFGSEYSCLSFVALHIYHPSFSIALLLTSLVGYSFPEINDSQQPFQCNGMLKTMFHQEPISVGLSGNTLTLSTYNPYSQDGDTISDEYLDFSLSSELIGGYTLGIQYPNGILAKRVDENQISLKHLHVNATILLSECTLLYPIEIDSFKGIMNLAPLLLLE